MKIEFKSNWGNFDYTATVELEDGLSEQTVSYVRKGIGNDMYRAAGSSLDKAFEKEFPAVAVKDKKLPATERGRRAVPFNAATKESFGKLVNEKLKELAEEEKGALITVVVGREHEFGAEGGVSSRVIATAVWTQMQSLPQEQFVVACMIYGVKLDANGDAESDESAIEAVHAFNQKSKKPATPKASPAAPAQVDQVLDQPLASPEPDLGEETK